MRIFWECEKEKEKKEKNKKNKKIRLPLLPHSGNPEIMFGLFFTFQKFSVP
jgi:hypothetical protein